MKERFFELARKVSKMSDHPQHKVGAVIVNKNRVVSVGHNKVKTHPKSNTHYKMMHAEHNAILGCSYEELKNCVAYVYREMKNGVPAISKPCFACEAALKQVGIRKVFYSDNGGYKEEIYG